MTELKSRDGRFLERLANEHTFKKYMKTAPGFPLLIGLIITAFTLVNEAEAQNLIVNGSFESPGFVTGNPFDAVFTLTPGSTDLTGWVVGERGAYWINSKFPDPVGVPRMEVTSWICRLFLRIRLKEEVFHRSSPRNPD